MSLSLTPTHPPTCRHPPPTHTHTQGLGLLINMSEHSAQNRTQLQSTRIDDHSTESSQETANKEEEEDIRMMQDDVMGCHGNRSSMKALIRLFLKHHAKSEQVSIEVHCVCVCVCVSEGTSHVKWFEKEHLKLCIHTCTATLGIKHNSCY